MNKYANGLGPTSWGFWCILIPYRKRFQLVGELHDLNYSIGGNEEDRRLSDEIFWAECRGLSKNYLQKLFSRLYYEAVRKFGYLYFKYK